MALNARVIKQRQKPQRDKLTPYKGRRGRLNARVEGPIRSGAPRQDKFVGGGPKPGLGGGPGPKAAQPQGRQFTPDSAYLNRVDALDTNQNERLNELGQAEQGIKFDFGIEDPTNPFSRAEGLKRSFLARQKGTSAGIAARGQLYSGVHERGLARVRRDEEEARAGLRSAYDEAINEVGAAKSGVKYETEEQKMQAFEDWLARVPDADVAAGDGTDPTGPGTPAPSTPKIGQLRDPEANDPPAPPRQLTATRPMTKKEIAKARRQGKRPVRRAALRKVRRPAARERLVA